MRNCSACPEAIACIRGGSEAPGLSGEVRFYQERGCVLVVANIAGLPQESGPDFFGFHIHEGGDCSGEGFSDTRGHYNPTNAPHPNHAGDLPPLMLCNGGAYLAVRTDRFCVRDIVGRTVVIHSGPDDFHSQPAGNAGIKIACGVICRR
ncbi:MAG: superoxide dismutase family protein [Acutalibacter sp.]|nr:superoxide dismutase family protein [Acutalibacter sp.]